MSHFDDHANIYDQLICLSKEQIGDPMLTLRDFFANYRLSELRKIQDDIQKVCLTTEGAAFGDPAGRSHLLRYNDKLICLLEAASRLQENFISADKAPKPEGATSGPMAVKDNYTQISEIVSRINDAAVDVANLCLIVVNAWHKKVLAELKVKQAKAEKGASSTSIPPLDLEKLHSLAIALQNKLAKLANVAVDILIKEMDIPRS